jgi:hypothetical protein
MKICKSSSSLFPGLKIFAGITLTKFIAIGTREKIDD